MMLMDSNYTKGESNEENESNILSTSAEGSKHLIGTLDPDYTSVPDTKELKLLEAKGEEELYDRVVRVVEPPLDDAVTEKQDEIEDIDNNILRIQQSLRTHRYCKAIIDLASVKVPKGKHNGCNRDIQNSHPNIRRRLRKASSNINTPTSQIISIKNEVVEEPVIKTAEDDFKIDLTNNLNSLIPVEANSCELLTQGRKGRFQTKMRMVVGNTYQYLHDSDEKDHLKFKWCVYVRGAPEKQDVSDFISTVKFTLDKSYSPHDVITVKSPPFSLIRRGWGEFKIYLELSFVDPRNKTLKLLHPLTLSRSDDSLAFTGIWRLGKELWYDIWLYDKTDAKLNELSKATVPCPFINNQDALINSLNIKGIMSKAVYTDEEGNITLAHSCEEPEIIKPPSKPAQPFPKPTKPLSKPTQPPSKSVTINPSSQSFIEKQLNNSSSCSIPNTLNNIVNIPAKKGKPSLPVNPFNQNSVIKTPIKSTSVMLSTSTNCLQLSTRKVVLSNPVCALNENQFNGTSKKFPSSQVLNSLIQNKSSNVKNHLESTPAGNVLCNNIVNTLGKLPKAHPLEHKLTGEENGAKDSSCKNNLSFNLVKFPLNGIKRTFSTFSADTNNCTPNYGDKKLIKILVRQSNGTLVPNMVTKDMYAMALKIYNKNKNKTFSCSEPAKQCLPTIDKQPISSTSKLMIKDMATTAPVIRCTNIQPRAPLISNPRRIYLKSNNGINSNVGQPLIRMKGPATYPKLPMLLSPRQTTNQTSSLPIKNFNTLGSQPVANVQKTNPPVPSVNIAGKSIELPHSLEKMVNTTLIGSNSIKLTFDTLSTKNTKILKTANGNKFVISPSQLPESILANNSSVQNKIKCTTPTVTTINGIKTQKITLNQVVNTNVKTFKINNNNLLCAVSSNEPSANVIPNDVPTSQIKLTALDSSSSSTGTTTALSRPTQPVSPITTIPIKSNPLSASPVTPGKITTRRIFISAPPHLVKLREEAAQKAQSGVEKGIAPKLNRKSGIKKSVEEIEQKITPLSNCEKTIRNLRDLCKHCTSAEEVLRIYMKRLPISTTENSNFKDFMVGTSYNPSDALSIGKCKALELWRARKIRQEMKYLKVVGWSNWDTSKIVSWARSRGFSNLGTESLKNIELSASNSPSNSLSRSISVMKDIKSASKQNHNCNELYKNVIEDIITIDSDTDEEKPERKFVALKKKEPEDPITILTPHTADACHFVDLSLSKLRMKLHPEEIHPGIKMEAAKNVIWKATMSFMEDLLRSSYAESLNDWNDDSSYHNEEVSCSTKPCDDETNSLCPDKPLLTVEARHLHAALIRGRPQFQLLTQYGLGKMHDEHFLQSSQMN